MASSLAVAMALFAPASTGFNGFSTNAFAADTDGDHAGKQGGPGTGKSQGGSQGSGFGGATAGSQSGGGYHGGTDFITQGQGGPDATSEGKGPKYGAGDTADSGGQPIWASEGIPEGDYGRLNVARAPQHTRDQALAEALTTLAETEDFIVLYPSLDEDGMPITVEVTRTAWSLYNVTDLATVVTLIENYRLFPIVRIDSPTQSLAVYQSVMTNNELLDLNGVTVAGDVVIQAAILLAGASDKTKAITTDTVVMVNTVLGLSSSTIGTTDEALAEAAEAVRQAIEIGHDAVIPVSP